MIELPAQFVARMKESLGEAFPSFLQSYSRPAERGLRVNTLKISVNDFIELSPFPLEQIPWEDSGFYSPSATGKTILHAAGLYYMQEPSAMCAAPELDVRAGERVLDLCSAPGGKGTQLAARMHGEGLLVLNEISYPRAKILSANVERMGVKNAVVVCASPEGLAGVFEGYFDKILVDAPCSGEGMFKKEEAAIPEWSIGNVLLCARRQAEILESAYKMLAGGGRMVYSTCTFAPEEDELQIERFASSHAVRLVKMQKLYPHEIRGEGHFYAVLEKTEGFRSNLKPLSARIDKRSEAIYRDWEKEYLGVKLDRLHTVGQTMYSLPDGMPDIHLQTLRAGVRLGELIGGRFEPSHSLAMCLTSDAAYPVSCDEATALGYLKGLTFPAEGKRGWRPVTYKDYPLGWCKVSDGVAKNKLPKGLRI